jgi:hypothetical protein
MPATYAAAPPPTYVAAVSPLLLLTSLAAAAGAGPRLTVLPNFGYTTDDGYGVGFYVELADRPSARARPRSLVVHTYLSSDGFQNQRLRFDVPGLGPAGRWRLAGLFAYRAWQHDAWFGLGPGTLRDPTLDPSTYAYGLVQPFGHLALAGDLAPTLSVYTSADLRWTAVSAEAGSLLAADAPAGMDGGFALQLGAGLLVDTRDRVVEPRRGVLVELGGRVAIDPTAPTHPFGGPFGSARAFLGAGPCVLAARLMGEHLFGDPPFYEMNAWGGFTPVLGLGGYETLRGLAYGRWHAPGKALLNTELRVDVARHPLAGGTLTWQLAPLVDAAALWGGGSQPEGVWPLHPTGGLGVRGVWSEGLVGRIDAAVGAEPVLVDGAAAVAPSWGVYLAFAQMF